MKQVYFVRHAKSSWADPFLSDEERPLNARGKRDAPFMASMMVLKEKTPDLIISSTAVRARRTAGYFRKAFGLKKNQLIKDHRLYLASPQVMIDTIRELPDQYESVYIFGHNPGMTDIANFFANDYVENVPTCGIFKVTCEVDAWYEINKYNSKLTVFYFPKQFNLDS